MDQDFLKASLKIEMRSWLQRQILHSMNPPTLNRCLETLAQMGFKEEELEKVKWDFVISFANRMAAKHGLRAEYLSDSKSVGVQGDDRTYTLTIVLIGPFPGYDALGELGTAIPNNLPVNRVTYEFARKGTSLAGLIKE